MVREILLFPLMVWHIFYLKFPLAETWKMAAIRKHGTSTIITRVIFVLIKGWRFKSRLRCGENYRSPSGYHWLVEYVGILLMSCLPDRAIVSWNIYEVPALQMLLAGPWCFFFNLKTVSVWNSKPISIDLARKTLISRVFTRAVASYWTEGPSWRA